MSESDNVKITADDVTRTYSLTVQSVSTENEGEYTVTASTDCAEISSAASIVIQRMFPLSLTHCSHTMDTDTPSIM